MSQASSDLDDPFANATVEAGPEDGMISEEPVGMAPPPPQYRKQDFSIYSILLILSFVFLMFAAIMFFIEAGKY
ncbi:MAG: hypothetical protein P8J27_05550 [Mariniblastus sp.]|nr:hypothetical protein [Mariniblastus sp.]